MDMPSYLMGKRAGGGTMVETDPIYSSSPASGITTEDITNWNGKQDTLSPGDNITISNNVINATNTTYSNATIETAGLMSAGDKTKLNGIASGAEVNVQANWNESDTSSDAYIQNKPTIPTVPTNVSAFTNDAGYLTQHQDISGKQDIIQYSTMPTASTDNLGKIVQFTGTTDSTYTNGYFYKCVSDGESTPTYSWESIDVQDASGGSSYTAGTNIEITSGNVINNTIPFSEHNSSSIMKNLILGTGAEDSGDYYGGGIAIGSNAKCSENCVIIGGNSGATGAWAKQNIIIGFSNNMANKDRCIGIGNNLNFAYTTSIAIGHGAKPTKYHQVMFGASGSNTYMDEIALCTQNGVKVMATEEFVQNYLTTVTGYDSTKTQVLKNVNGTLTWVDE